MKEKTVIDRWKCNTGERFAAFLPIAEGLQWSGRTGWGPVQKRIFGVETEYGIIFTPEGRKTLPVEKAIRFLFEKLITTEHFLNVFL